MATESWPAVGDGGLTEAQWASGYDAEDGIINDYHASGVAACTMTRDNATNTCTVAPGQVRVSGYTLAVTSATVLSCPPVSSTTVYTIAAQYDPALNVADGGGAADPLGPCRLIIQAGSLDTSGGKQYVVLYTVTRTNGGALTAAAVSDRRKWVGPTVSLPDYVGGDPAVYPRGTLLIQTASDGTPAVNMSSRQPNALGSALEWQNLLAPLPQPFPSPGALVAVDANTPPQYLVEGARVYLRGTLRRSSGAALGTGDQVTLGTMPAGLRPAYVENFICVSSGNPTRVAAVSVSPDGTVRLLQSEGQATITWVALNNISYRVGN